MPTVACDTDFLMKIANDPLPNFDWQTLSKQNDFCTLPCIFRELTNLKSSRERGTARRAIMALSIVGTQPSSKIRLLTFKKLKSEPSWANYDASADDALVEFIEDDPPNRFVATLDGMLLSRLEKNGLPYMTLSSGRALIAPHRPIRLTRRRVKDL